MRFAQLNSRILFPALLAGLLGSTHSVRAGFPALPEGLVLNLDLQHIQNGLIPNKTPYPLYVPLGEIGARTFRNRTVLEIKRGQGLQIPHSVLLDPDGRGWAVSIRILAKTDGIVLSQSNGKEGYTIQIKDGAVQVAIQTGSSTALLQGTEQMGITPCLGKWTTIDLQILPGRATLCLNRIRVAAAPLESPLSGKDLRIRLGEQPGQSVSGFSGAVSSLKIFRQ